MGKYLLVFHAVHKLKEADICNILVVAGKEHMGDVVNLLGSGREMGVTFTYKGNDPTLAIDWPVDNPIMSDKDKKLPLLKDANLNF